MGIDQPDGDDGLAHARDLSGAPASRQPRDAGDTFHATVAPEDATVASEKTAAGPVDVAVVSEETAAGLEDVAVVSEETVAGPEEVSVLSEETVAGPEEVSVLSEKAVAGSDGNEDQDRAETSDAGTERQVRIDRVTEHRATVDAAYRAYAIDQAYEKISEIERGTVTPAMRRIEAEDPDRHLAGLENRLKGKDRLAEKVTNFLKSSPGLSLDQAAAKVKDAIRYTFVYDDDHYTEGVRADTQRLADDFELVDLRNSWPAAEYKGINTRWRVAESSQVFEIQFHTHASFEAKQFTHGAYEKIRDPSTPRGERDKLQDFQRQVSADIPVPRNVTDIKDYP